MSFGVKFALIFRVMTALAVAVSATFLAAGPASAVLTSNTIGCSGSATVTGDDGGSTEVNANDETVVLPRAGSVAYSGSVATPTHDHHGEVRLAVGALDVTVGRWGPSANAEGATSAQGVQRLPAFLDQVPDGRYRLSGFHQGREGGCEGEITVELQGGTGVNAANVGGVVGTIIAACALAFAARPRRHRVSG